VWGAISVIFYGQVFLWLANVEEMKYTYNRFCDRTMDGKIALYSVCGIPYYTKSW